MKRELKRQIKQNELVTGVQEASRWTAAHESQVKITAAVVVVRSRSRSSASRLTRTSPGYRGSPLLHGPRDVPLAGVVGAARGFEPPPGTLYATAAEKYRKAAGQFDEVASKYGSLDVGSRARYYAALCRTELGEYDAAEKTLTELANRPRAKRSRARWRAWPSPTPPPARTGGQGGRGLPASATTPRSCSPRPRAAGARRRAGTAKRPAEAGAAYKRVYEEFPDSVYAPVARRRATFLKDGAGAAQG